jgi:hypothetical protein
MRQLQLVSRLSLLPETIVVMLAPSRQPLLHQPSQ